MAEVGIGADPHYFFRAGENITLPCVKAVAYGPVCSQVSWFYYYNESSQAVSRIIEGDVERASPGSSRVSLASNCSLILHKVTDEDTGKYVCRVFDQNEMSTTVFLGVLNVSQAPSVPNQNSSEVTVQCSVSRFSRQCRDGMDRRQSRTFTCQYFNAKDLLLISADYTPDLPESQSLFVYIVSAAVAVLLLLAAAAGLFLKMKSKATTQGDPSGTEAGADAENNVTYAVIDHNKAKRKKQVKNSDSVTYSTVNLQNRAKPDHSATYSQVVYRVTRGQVLKQSPGSSRVSLSSDCSLILHNVTDEDAGKYIYRVSDHNLQKDWDTTVYLGVVSAPPSSDPKYSPSSFTIQCSVFRFSRECGDGRIVWSDRNGKITSNVIQYNCVSYLTVERRLSRTFTCRYFNKDNKPFVSVDYTPEVTLQADIYKYFRAGEDVTLPCDRLKNQGPSCSTVDWFYYKDGSKSDVKVSGGQSKDPRLRLNSECSLIVKNASAEDAGLFFCHLSGRTDSDTNVYLSVLTVSRAPPDPNQKNIITFQCKLWRYSGQYCSDGKFYWLDQNKKMLSEQNSYCESSLEVDLQKAHSRTFTCQYQRQSKLVVFAETDPLTKPEVCPQAVFIYKYFRAGEDVTVPCDRLKHQGPSCSNVDWLYDDGSKADIKVSEGQSQDPRLRLNSNCSVTVQNVSSEDAGSFVCRLSGRPDSDTVVYLSVLTVSRAPPDPNQNNITLQCKLWRYRPHDCSGGGFYWLDQDKKNLSVRENVCESSLEVDLQKKYSRTFTCQYHDQGRRLLLVSAETGPFTKPEVTTAPTPKPPNTHNAEGDPNNTMIYIICGAVASVLLLLVVAAVVFVKIKSKSSPQRAEHIYDDPQPAATVVDPESNLTYAMINHKKPAPKTEQSQVVVEDSVTYSAVTIKKRDDSHSAIYSTVNNT
ncbi:hypothetical protein WMY93_025090 [Mugilogobius chulae]|uniref:Ig-like domain-containing protein n=1 Tax=Mugilogobius chulae TaxID=88201 RepID=A0AAW0N6B7_9GOBI